MPSNILSSSNSFRGQLTSEQTVLVSRRHWIVLFGPIFFIIIFAFLPSLIYHYVSQTSWYLQWMDLFWFLMALYYFFLWNVLFYNLMIYTLNTVVVTNKRVIKNEQNGFFRYASAELDLPKIQDVSVKVHGILAAILRFGDLEIQTAGSQNKFLFDRLPNPEKIKQTIADLQAL
ncbi:MAG: PH domain-containing protein [Patescibacteria group bacterium]